MNVYPTFNSFIVRIAISPPQKTQYISILLPHNEPMEHAFNFRQERSSFFVKSAQDSNTTANLIRKMQRVKVYSIFKNCDKSCSINHARVFCGFQRYPIPYDVKNFRGNHELFGFHCKYQILVRNINKCLIPVTSSIPIVLF